MDILIALGTAIRQKRRDRGWTQAELGARSRVRRQTISAIESGKFGGRISDVARVAHVLGYGIALEPAKRPQLDDLPGLFDED